MITDKQCRSWSLSFKSQAAQLLCPLSVSRLKGWRGVTAISSSSENYNLSYVVHVCTAPPSFLCAQARHYIVFFLAFFQCSLLINARLLFLHSSVTLSVTSCSISSVILWLEQVRGWASLGLSKSGLSKSGLSMSVLCSRINFIELHSISKKLANSWILCHSPAIKPGSLSLDLQSNS